MTALQKCLWMTVAMSCLGGCVAATEQTVCDGFKPVRPTKTDIETMSDTQVMQILSHNQFGQKYCGWRP